MENLKGGKWRITENGLARWVETMYILSLVDLHFLEHGVSARGLRSSLKT